MLRVRVWARAPQVVLALAIELLDVTVS